MILKSSQLWSVLNTIISIGSNRPNQSTATHKNKQASLDSITNWCLHQPMFNNYFSKINLNNNKKISAQPYWAAGKAPSDITVVEESNVEIDCQVHGTPKPNMTWFINGENVKGYFNIDWIYTISSRDSPPLLMVLLKRRHRSEKMDFYGALYRATWKKDFFLTFSRRDSPALRSCLNLFLNKYFGNIFSIWFANLIMIEI